MSAKLVGELLRRSEHLRVAGLRARACASGSRRCCCIGIAITGDRWKTVRWSASWAASCTTCTPLAPVPIDADPATVERRRRRRATAPCDGTRRRSGSRPGRSGTYGFEPKPVHSSRYGRRTPDRRRRRDRPPCGSSGRTGRARRAVSKSMSRRRSSTSVDVFEVARRARRGRESARSTSSRATRPRSSTRSSARASRPSRPGSGCSARPRRDRRSPRSDGRRTRRHGAGATGTGR